MQKTRSFNLLSIRIDMIIKTFTIGIAYTKTIGSLSAKEISYLFQFTYQEMSDQGTYGHLFRNGLDNHRVGKTLFVWSQSVHFLKVAGAWPENRIF